MSDPRVSRKLAVIVSADVAGYSWLVAGDEEGTIYRFTRSSNGNKGSSHRLRRWILTERFDALAKRIIKVPQRSLVLERRRRHDQS